MAPDLDPSSPATADGVSQLPVVEVRGVSKIFGRIRACDNVDLTLQPGRIHGLLGQNGAGKSTLAKMLVGLYTPDDGEIRVRGKRVVIRSLAESIELGIGMVHQHFSLIEPLAVWENVTLGEGVRPDQRAISAELATLGERYGLEVDPSALVENLTVGERQRVEILKTLRRDPSVLILDEPTSSLTLAESRDLFEVLRRVVRDEGRTVVLISHKLDEILHATDDVTIMRNGQVVASLETSETDAPKLAREMVGRPVSLRSASAALGLLDTIGAAAGSHAVARNATPMLQVVDATARDGEGRVLLDGLSIDVHAGEIVGLAGVEGNGQRALGDLLAGILDLESGSVFVDGKEIDVSRPGEMTRARVGNITEDRHHSGSVLAMSVAENLILGHVGHVLERGFISKRKLRAMARERIEMFDVHTASEDAPFWSLSGGNQQRVVLARELSSNPKVLVAAQPTRGLDVGAIEYMSERLRACAEDGMAVLVISTELEEILDLSDRVAVIHRGRITGVRDRAGLDPESLGLLMGGEAA